MRRNYFHLLQKIFLNKLEFSKEQIRSHLLYTCFELCIYLIPLLSKYEQITLNSSKVTPLSISWDYFFILRYTENSLTIFSLLKIQKISKFKFYTNRNLFYWLSQNQIQYYRNHDFNISFFIQYPMVRTIRQARNALKKAEQRQQTARSDDLTSNQHQPTNSKINPVVDVIQISDDNVRDPAKKIISKRRLPQKTQRVWEQIKRKTAPVIHKGKLPAKPSEPSSQSSQSQSESSNESNPDESSYQSSEDSHQSSFITPPIIVNEQIMPSKKIEKISESVQLKRVPMIPKGGKLPLPSQQEDGSETYLAKYRKRHELLPGQKVPHICDFEKLESQSLHMRSDMEEESFSEELMQDKSRIIQEFDSIGDIEDEFQKLAKKGTDLEQKMKKRLAQKIMEEKERIMKGLDQSQGSVVDMSENESVFKNLVQPNVDYMTGLKKRLGQVRQCLQKYEILTGVKEKDQNTEKLTSQFNQMRRKNIQLHFDSLRKDRKYDHLLEYTLKVEQDLLVAQLDSNPSMIGFWLGACRQWGQRFKITHPNFVPRFKKLEEKMTSAKLKFEYFFEKANNAAAYKILAFLKQNFSKETLQRTHPQISCPFRLFHEEDIAKFTEEVEERIDLFIGYTESRFGQLRKNYLHLYGDYDRNRISRRFDLEL